MRCSCLKCLHFFYLWLGTTTHGPHFSLDPPSPQFSGAAAPSFSLDFRQFPLSKKSLCLKSSVILLPAASVSPRGLPFTIFSGFRVPTVPTLSCSGGNYAMQRRPVLCAETCTSFLVLLLIFTRAASDVATLSGTRLYLVRHGLAVHNVLEAPGHCNDSYILDPPLVSRGTLEAVNAGHLFAVHRVPVHAIFSSPLFRALQTTALLRRAGWGDAASSYALGQELVLPPVRVVEALRERGSACTADWRRPSSVSAAHFPEFDFSSLEDKDPMRSLESPAQSAERAARFLDTLRAFVESERAVGRTQALGDDNAGGSRPPLSIVVVSHASFLDDLLQSDAGLYGLAAVTTAVGPAYSYEERAIRNGAVFAFDLLPVSN